MPGGLLGDMLDLSFSPKQTWLAQHLNDPSIRIVDMRSEGAFQKGHIPGAVNLGWKALKDADNEVYVIPPEKLAGLMSQLGDWQRHDGCGL